MLDSSTESPNPALNPSPDESLGGIEAGSERYNEMYEAAGRPRAQWEAFDTLLRNTKRRELNRRLTSARRQIRDSGVTYNVYTDPEGQDRQWELDVLPLVLSQDEWRYLESGLGQRARLFNLILADLYGNQDLLLRGLIPAALVLGNSSFLRNAHGMLAPGSLFLHLYAADLTRSPDGQWWVIADRTQAPSGAGYALENRLIVSQVFPELFRSMGVQHLADYFTSMRNALLAHAPKGDGPQLAVVLTPGPFNETYFEHAFLARYLGFRLVEGNDLTVHDGKVWLKTVEGPLRVHVIIRRQDDTFCDPLELRVDSTLGTASLMQCVRQGSVLMANPPGSGILEAGALMGYLPRLCEYLLGEKLILPSIATWWCGEPAAMEDAFTRYKQLVFKPADPSHRFFPIFGNALSGARFAQLQQDIRRRPERYLAQEMVQVSQAPVLSTRTRQKLRPRNIGLRMHACVTPSGDYMVMPGGLTRVTANAKSRVVSMQRGGSSKDTWVLGGDEREDAQMSLLSSSFSPRDLVPFNAAVTSRVAENEFWFGRTCERCESIARLLRVALTTILREAPVDPQHPVLDMARAWSLLDAGHEIEAALLASCTQEELPFSLAANLRYLNQQAFQLRDRFSADHWRVLNQIQHNQQYNKTLNIDQALAWLDSIIVYMTTLSGFALDSMTRDSGFRFLSIGRRLERLSFMTRVFSVALDAEHYPGLTWLLELCDSIITYRGRYMSQPQWLPVLDLLIRDEANPRSLLFQARGLHDYLDKMENKHGPCGRQILREGLRKIAALDTATDFTPDSARLRETLALLHNLCYQLNDQLTSQFFTHPRTQSAWSSPWL
ncbi:MAG: circularly permuted type 2 ATP-grasp protein [Pseudomonadales bacterium]|jgi:uncharacterized circularly permuted ATP-grasp superfamily protein/uncharacterized alpha-E superfamily protein|nr:circularly permuted type 2 ATP-grasp protein [Pseudomonadales bacterium]